MIKFYRNIYFQDTKQKANKSARETFSKLSLQLSKTSRMFVFQLVLSQNCLKIKKIYNFYYTWSHQIQQSNKKYTVNTLFVVLYILIDEKNVFYRVLKVKASLVNPKMTLLISTTLFRRIMFNIFKRYVASNVTVTYRE